MAKLVLQPDKASPSCGQVYPAEVVNNKLACGGIQCGHWTRSGDRIVVHLNDDLEVIIHEVATRKAIRAELRAAERDAIPKELSFEIVMDPQTRKFKKVYKER